MERATVLSAAIGERVEPAASPVHAFERTAYRFDVLTDCGAFRGSTAARAPDHRLAGLHAEARLQRPEAVADAGVLEDWRQVVEASADLHDAVAAAGWKAAAAYAVAMAYRVRFYMDMNAREAMHVIELRTAPQGHPAYRQVCQAMHRLIADQAGTGRSRLRCSSRITRRWNWSASDRRSAGTERGAEGASMSEMLRGNEGRTTLPYSASTS